MQDINDKIPRGEKSTPSGHQEGSTRPPDNSTGERSDNAYRHIVGILLAEPETGKIISINNRTSEILGYSTEEIGEKTVFDITYVDDINAHTEQFRRLCAEEIPFFSREERLIRKDGSILWSIVTMELVKNSKGQAMYAAASIVDITARKIAEDALRQSEEYMRLIIESLKDYAIFIIDQDRHVLSWNIGAKEIFGYQEEDILGRVNDILFVPEDVNNAVPQKEVETALRQGRAYDDRWHLRKDGSRFFASGVVAPLHQEGNTAKLVKVARDLTDRINSEELLKKTNRHKTEFLATLAHELRNPLASIHSGMEVLRHERDAGNRLKTQETVERQLQQIIHLVNDLLDISRIDQGKINLNIENISLKDALNLALETTRSIIDGYRHQLTVSIPEQTIVVEGDISRLSQVFLNILVNAAKYTQPGGKITLAASVENDEAVVRVRDTGLGIPDHMLSKIFDMFAQVQDRNEYPQAGLGIGLSVVKQFVEMHGGRVEVFSEGEKMGTEFTVRLPLAKQQQLSPQPQEPVDQQTAADISRRVLIVDDNSDAADMMEILLKKKGFKIQKAYDGKSAIQVAKQFDPEIILLDIGLPDMNGYDLAKVLREDLGDRYFIAVSGWGQEEDIQRSRRAGFHHHVVKPVDIGTIEKLLNSVGQPEE